MTDSHEIKKLDSGFQLILITWVAIFCSLGVYLGVCLFLKDTFPSGVDDGFLLATLKYVLLGLSVVTLGGVHFFKGFLLKYPGFARSIRPVIPGQHPAVARYTLVVIITSALLETIGIYGLILFLVAGDTLFFYQLLGLSAGAMIVYRPRKEELKSLFYRMNQVG